jgi:hypothetical protein
VGNVRPRSNDGAKDHEAEAQQGHACDGSAEPQHLAVCDQDDGQVLEDGVDGNAEELQGLAAGVNHADQQKGDGEPFSRLVGVEVAELCNAHGLECLNCDDADDALCDVLSATCSYLCSCSSPSNSNSNLSRTHLDCQKEEVEVEAAVQDVFVRHSHEDAAATVCQEGHGRVVGQGGGRRSHLRFRSGVEGVVGLSVA